MKPAGKTQHADATQITGEAVEVIALAGLLETTARNAMQTAEGLEPSIAPVLAGVESVAKVISAKMDAILAAASVGAATR